MRIGLLTSSSHGRLTAGLLRKFAELRVRWFCFLVLAGLCYGAVSSAQQPAGRSPHQVPDTPQPKSDVQEQSAPGAAGKVVGYVTNRSLFFPEIATSPRSLSRGEKFKLFIDQSISPADLVVSGFSAGFGQARDVPHGYGQGAAGFGKRFGAAMARNASNNFFGTFVLASALHQDPRFFPHANPTLWGSAKYAVKRLIVTRNDAGGAAFNSSDLLGTLAGEGLANAYLPVSEQSAGKTFERFGTDLAWRAAGNMFKNYWPTIFKSLGLKRLGVVPIPAPPLSDSPESDR